jgi:hypothetical protein
LPDVTVVFGSLDALKVPAVILSAFVVSMVAELANPDTALELIAMAMLVELVIRPVESIFNDTVFAALPYAPGATVVFGSLDAFKVPRVMLSALVVSIVAEFARPDTALAAIAMDVFVALVIRPVESTLKVTVFAALPYHEGVTVVFGSLDSLKVPRVMLAALVVSIVAELARPDTALAAIAIGVFVALVMRPVASTLNTTVLVALPYAAGVTAVLGNLLTFNVPKVMLSALVVSIVAEFARPDTALDAIAMGVFVALVIRPVASTLIVIAFVALPYHVGVTAVVGILALFNIPDVMLSAFVVSMVAEVARPDTAVCAIAIDVFVALVIRPVASTLNTTVLVALPYAAGVTAVLGNLASLNVPVVILLALVVSIVAELARPDTALDAIAIGVFVALVMRPVASILSATVFTALPYHDGVTVVFGNLA